MIKNKRLFRLIIALIAGATLTLAFAPFRIDFIAIVSLCVFFYLIDNSPTKRNKFIISFLFGFGFFATSVSWVYISISLFTQSITIGFVVALALVILLCFLLTIPFAFSIHFFIKQNSKLSKIILYPALWTLFEIFKANVLWGGFPWVSVGYSQTESPLIWFAPIGGVYLVSYIIALIAILINQLILKDFKIKKSGFTIICILAIFCCGYALAQIKWYQKSNNAQNVVLVQGDFIQGFKWNYDNFTKMTNYYKKIASNYQNSIILLSENAIPTFREQAKNYFTNLNNIAIANNNSIMIGSLSIDKSNAYYNTATIVGTGSGEYFKHHLVPFGEYFPIISSFSYSKEVGLSGFSRGKYIQPLMNMSGNTIANFICYEVAYPEQVRDQLQGASFITVISDDAWFGDSIARDQQIQIAQVRSIENAKYLLHDTNNGITAIIKPNGDIQSILPKDIQANLEGKIYVTQSYTIWKVIGMSLIWVIIVSSIFLGIIIRFLRIFD